VVQKPSLPDLHQLAGQLDSLPAAIAFDSLAGVLPPQLVAAAASATAAAPSRRLNRELVDRAAAWLRTQLGLRLFGFDVVVQQTSGRHHPCCAFPDAWCRQPSSMHMNRQSHFASMSRPVSTDIGNRVAKTGSSVRPYPFASMRLLVSAAGWSTAKMPVVRNRLLDTSIEAKTGAGEDFLFFRIYVKYRFRSCSAGRNFGDEGRNRIAAKRECCVTRFPFSHLCQFLFQ